MTYSPLFSLLRASPPVGKFENPGLKMPKIEDRVFQLWIWNLT